MDSSKMIKYTPLFPWVIWIMILDFYIKFTADNWISTVPLLGGSTIKMFQHSLIFLPFLSAGLLYLNIRLGVYDK